MKERFCALCSCTSHSDMPLDLRKNWVCPILGKKICKVDCIYEVAGGMGAPDTLRRVSKMSDKSPQEIHSICVVCRHGGRGLDRPGRIVSITNKDGKEVTSGPEIEQLRRKSAERDLRRLRWLRGALPEGTIRGMNLKRGFAPHGGG